MKTAASVRDPIRTCAHFGLRYDWRRSPRSSLKMTFCGSLCERAGLGFTIEALRCCVPTCARRSALRRLNACYNNHGIAPREGNLLR
jgi:hypothetical protein